MADQTKADIDAIGVSGMNIINHIAQNYGTRAVSPTEKISAATPGAVRTNEAQTFADWYASLAQALSYFLADSIPGIESLGYILLATAGNYRRGDLSQAQAMNDVAELLISPNGPPSAKPDPVVQPPGNDTEDQFHHPKSTDRMQLCTGPEQQTPDQQVHEHEKIYGTYEHWRPEDPYAPVPPPPEPVGPYL